jgi:hypothetical protein
LGTIKILFGTARAFLVPGQCVRFWKSRSGRNRMSFFVCETHLDKAKAEKLKRRLGCDHYIINESDGRSGGFVNAVEEGDPNSM